MKTNEIIKALRCISTAGGEADCEHCPYWREENVPEELRPVYGADTEHSCDIDRVGLDGADVIEKLLARCARYAEEIAVLQEKEKWISTTERLPEAGETVLAVVYGKPNENVELIGAIELAEWYKDGWLVEAWPDLNGTVTHWLPMPTKPETEKALSADNFCNCGVKANGGMSDE